MIATAIVIVLAITAAAVRRVQRRFYLEDLPHVSRKTLARINELYPHGS